MKYVNANMILPDALVEQLQEYVQGGYIYIPAKHGQRKQWGEVSGYKKELIKRNACIIEEYNNGSSIETIAEKYFLSTYTIMKIVYQK